MTEYVGVIWSGPEDGATMKASAPEIIRPALGSGWRSMDEVTLRWCEPRNPEALGSWVPIDVLRRLSKLQHPGNGK